MGVLRQGKVLLQSSPQQHRFNTPFQLMAPVQGTATMRKSSGGDQPRDADIVEFTGVCSGDVIVLGSDGLFDNMFAGEVADTVSQVERAEKEPSALALGA